MRLWLRITIDDHHNQYLNSKLRHLISECTLKHFKAHILYPQRGQLDRDIFPQIEQYFLEGYLGLPTFMLQKLGSPFSYNPYSCITFLKFKFLFSWHYFFTLLIILFSFFSFLVLPSSSKTSWSSNYAILSGSSKKSSSRYINLS